jgi:hypothetical protein
MIGNRAFARLMQDERTPAGSEQHRVIDEFANVDGRLARNGGGKTKAPKAPKAPKVPPPPSAVTFAAVRANSTPTEMTHDRIPPRKTTKVNATVTGFVKGSDKVDITIDGGGGSAGDATIMSGKKLSGTGTVEVKGGTQTTPGSADGLTLVATQGGTEVGRSAPFSISAIPQNFSDTLKAKVDDGTKVGIVVNDRWESDSGSVADLDQAEITEEVEETKATGPFVGLAKVNSGYLPADSFTTDSHTTGVGAFPAGAVDGVREVDQTSAFKDNRTGETDIPMRKSGLKVVRTFEVSKKGKRTLKIKKFGAAATANGISSTAGRCSVSASFKIP